MSALRAGILGLGQMGRNHVRVYRELDGVDLVAVCDVAADPDGVASDVPVVQSVEELIAFGLDMCVVAVPTASHVGLGLQLAQAGVHAMIEKPLAHDLASADQLIAGFDKAGLIGCVGHVERYNPAIRAMRDRMAQGQLGSVFQISTRRQGPFVVRLQDVGVVKDLGTHDIDLAMWLVGEPITAVSARTAHRMGREHEDLAAITSRFGDGVVGNHLVNWISPFKERLTYVTGENGCLVADTITADLTYWANGESSSDWAALRHTRGMQEGDVIRYAIPKPEPIVAEAEAFREAVLGNGADIVTLAEGRTVLEVAEACLRSAELGMTVDVPQTTVGN